ncbi:transglutaminase domain-containing protein [Roseburia inulinivorans]|uniref:Ig-like domain-containing protein n=2 Tax=Roseburia inulinivorans TaxID=360807 RepID=A0A396AGP6_9FIRM|nr:transglutaminase domain-containing protein [Roseburia inulinivorans]RHD05355.1 hypothetical protein DW813_03165 [Roseburia inulinivorans]
MNKRVKKCFICCLVLSLFFTSFPQLLVYAENTEQPVQSKVSEEVEYVTFVEDETNELGMSEEKVVSVEEIAPYVILADGETLPQIKTDEVSVLSDDVVQLDTEDALYQYLKEQVVARNSQITVSVPIEINNKIGPVSAMTSAQEYTESCTGQEGDALKYGGVGYSVSTRSYTGATRVTYTYYMNYFSTAEQEKQLTSAVTCALASLNLNGKTDVEKVIAIHNYICDHVDYDYDGLSDSTNTVKYTAYGALCNGKAVCNGYAVLFYRMCKDAGLSVRIIPGTANGGAHAWNIVRVGNVYYNVDTTWDGQDTQTFNRYLLKNENDFSADHTRRENCATEEFNDAYPMAEQSYVLPATDSDLPAINHDTPLNIDNTWIFENVTTNNEIISTQAVGKPKLLIYFISVYDCLSQFQGLYKENADLDIIAMPMDTAVKEDVQKFQELYDYKNITFTYEGKDSLIADQLGRYLYLKDCNRVCYPFFVYIDQNNKIQYMSTDDNKYSIQNNLDFYCNFGNNKMVDVKYDPNGGDGNCITKSYPLNQRVILEECKYSRTGYRFKGWSQGLDSRLYKSGEAFMPYDRTVTLYAKWEAVESNNIKIVDQPVDKTVEEGMTTSFTVKAEGEGLSYQWQYKQAGSTTWSDWSGQTKATLKVGYLEKRNGMSFRCIVKDASGYKTISDEAKLTYVNGPKIIQQPENKTVEEGMTTSFTVKAEGEGLSYQWQYKQAGSTTWSDWSGQTKATLKVGYLEKRNGMSFRCIVKDASGYKTISDEAKLTYVNGPKIIQQPENKTVEEGMTTSFTVKAEGEGLSYQWQYKQAGSTTWSDWSGQTKATLKVGYLEKRNGMSFRCIVKDASGYKTISDEAKLTYVNGPKIIQQPENKTVEEGMTTSFTVKAEGEGLSYQWQYKQAGSTTWSDWSGQTKTTLKVGYLEKRNGMSFRCIVKDASGYKTISNEALLIYNQKVQTTFSKTSGNVTFKVQYPENITCGMPTTFKLSSEGTTDKVQYALYSLTTEDGTIVYDTSYGSNGKFFSKDSFDFTFYASGTYYIRFAIMDTGVSPYVWFNTGLYGIKLVIDDKGYPTVENVVADLKAQCGKTCTTDFEKAVWFNDWLVENCRYDSSYSYCAPEGALARGSGTCEAYHRAYVMLLNSVGIATDRISGDGHVWTGVQLDGNWYHIDTTWDDAGYEDNSVDLQHLYFGLNDELMNQIHSSVTSSNGISAHSLEDNYFIKTGKIKKWSDQYVSTIREHLNNGENTFDITINDSMIDSYKQIIYYLVAYQLSNTDWGGEKLTVTYSENILHCVVE